MSYTDCLSGSIDAVLLRRCMRVMENEKWMNNPKNHRLSEHLRNDLLIVFLPNGGAWIASAFPYCVLDSQHDRYIPNKRIVEGAKREKLCPQPSHAPPFSFLKTDSTLLFEARFTLQAPSVTTPRCEQSEQR